MKLLQVGFEEWDPSIWVFEDSDPAVRAARLRCFDASSVYGASMMFLICQWRE